MSCFVFRGRFGCLSWIFRHRASQSRVPSPFCCRKCGGGRDASLTCTTPNSSIVDVLASGGFVRASPARRGRGEIAAAAAAPQSVRVGTALRSVSGKQKIFPQSNLSTPWGFFSWEVILKLRKWRVYFATKCTGESQSLAVYDWSPGQGRGFS